MKILLALIGGILIGAAIVFIIDLMISTVGTIFIKTIDKKHLYQLEVKDLDKLAKSKFVIFKVDVSEYQDDDA